MPWEESTGWQTFARGTAILGHETQPVSVMKGRRRPYPKAIFGVKQSRDRVVIHAGGMESAPRNLVLRNKSEPASMCQNPARV